ncbi:MAG: hypothetical protein CL843_17210 [Crocinitomicaceae bacterium]|nr:hypothetical protein [Crocinitomicaceae bacterium]|tara:strand:- start:23579 stop:23980 length:402 start_codon:yes stop_codon:yes gene_type:complete
MKKDINFPKVQGVHIAILREQVEKEQEWAVYIINENNHDIVDLMVTSKGYGEAEGKNIQTTALRRYIEKVEANSSLKFEIIPEELLGITNEFWLSYYINKTIYDKKYIFLPDSLIEENLITVPIVNKKGVLIE